MEKVRGVFFDNNSGKYRCFIHINNKKIWLGYYADQNEAIRIRKEAAKYYKEDYEDKEWGILHFYKNLFIYRETEKIEMNIHRIDVSISF